MRRKHVGRAGGTGIGHAAPATPNEGTHSLERDLVGEIAVIAKAMNCYVEFLGQRRADKAGQSIGTPDMLVYRAGQVLPVELKRAKNHDGTPAGKLSIGQIVAMERRQEAGVRTAVVTTVEEFVAIVNGMCKARGVVRRAEG